MAAKTTSGSGFHFRLAFYALDFVENKYNIERVRRTLFEIFGAKVRKFKKKFKRVTRISHSRLFDILWPLGPPTTVPKTSHFGLTFNFLRSFEVFGLRAGLHSTVLPSGVQARGPIEKFDPPHAQIWGPTPDFKILMCVHAEGLQIPKI